MKKIIVDIDNTLWHFAPVLYERMKKVNPDVIPFLDWNKFDFWKSFMPAKTFYSIIKGIHMDQEQFTPYPDAKLFLSSLKDMDFYIIIASHREKESLHATINWLKKYELVFHEIYLSFDKSVLFDDCWAVVDDSNFVLDKAVSAGIIGTGLKMPWNEHGNYIVFDNLIEILNYLKGHP